MAIGHRQPQFRRQRRHFRHFSSRSIKDMSMKLLFLLAAMVVIQEKHQHFLVQAFSASPPENTPYNNMYVSKSTATPEQSSLFSEGSEFRKERLDSALRKVGIDPSSSTFTSNTCGSAALRAYRSFLLPKSKGAFAVAESPQRATVVANNISFYIREYRSHQEEWIVNHDKCSLGQHYNSSSELQRQPLTLVLDNIRSAANVGNIFRAAEAAHISSVCLCGMTPAPPHPKVLKTAVGSAEYVPYTQSASTLDVVRKLQNEGVTVLGVETTSKSTPMWQTTMPQPLALVFGNELVGVHVDVLNECDGLVCIPTNGIKNSFNVATCASIVMWEALRQWQVIGDDGMNES
jgi:tRNA G18 (ribose-2'-O)-methylase SpoU